MSKASDDLQRTLGRIEAKLDGLTNTFVEHIKDDKSNFAILGLRVSTMEKKMWTFGGAMAVIIFASGFLKDKVASFFG